MTRRPPRSTLPDTLLPYTTLVRSMLSKRAVSRTTGPGERNRSRSQQNRALFAYSSSREPSGDRRGARAARLVRDKQRRSEEHTSDLQSLMRHSYAVFCVQKKINSHLPCNTQPRLSPKCNYTH